MTRYGIADIGSNTIVLLIYEMQDGKPVGVYHKSTPAHLIDDVSADRIMSSTGIEKAVKTLKKYAKKLDEMEVEHRWGCITEPCRIVNRNDLVEALETTGFEIHPLSGEEEASLDYRGTLFSCPEIRDGIAFDVGGGSTELIRFEKGKAVTAMSFPLGCVRLSHLPLDTPKCMESLLKAQKDYPALGCTCDNLIGIGGSLRYAGLLLDDLYHTGYSIPVSLLQEVYERLVNEESEAVAAMNRVVDQSRIPVFLPGVHMILEICALYKASSITVSPTGIREGFLLSMLEKHDLLK